MKRLDRIIFLTFVVSLIVVLCAAVRVSPGGGSGGTLSSASFDASQFSVSGDGVVAIKANAMETNVLFANAAGNNSDNSLTNSGRFDSLGVGVFWNGITVLNDTATFSDGATVQGADLTVEYPAVINANGLGITNVPPAALKTNGYTSGQVVSFNGTTFVPLTPTPPGTNSGIAIQGGAGNANFLTNLNTLGLTNTGPFSNSGPAFLGGDVTVSGAIAGTGAGITNLYGSNVVGKTLAPRLPAFGSYPSGGSSLSGNFRLGRTASIVMTNVASLTNGTSLSSCNLYPGLTRLPNGHLLATWVSAPTDAGVPGQIWSLVSSNMGATWGKLTEVYAPTNAGPNGSMNDVGGFVMDNGKLLLLSNYGETNGVQLLDMKLTYLIGVPNPDDTITWLSTNIIQQVGGGGYFDRQVWTDSQAIQLRNGNIVWTITGQFQNGHPGVSNTVWMTAALISTNRGTTWGNPILISSNDVIQYAECALVEMPTGRIVGIERAEDYLHYTAHYGYYARVYSDDGGNTWSAPSNVLSPPNGTNVVGKPSLWLSDAGGLLMIARSSAFPAAFYTTSWDYGLTWSDVAFLSPTNRSYAYSSLAGISGGEAGALVAFAFGDYSSIQYFSFLDGYGSFANGNVDAFQLAAVSNLYVGPLANPSFALNSNNLITLNQPLQITGAGIVGGLTLSNTATPNYFSYSNGQAVLNGTNVAGSSNAFLALTNSVDATASIIQETPSFMAFGSSWATTPVASGVSGIRYRGVPVNGTTSYGITHYWDHKITSGAWVNDMTLTSGGTLTTVLNIVAGVNISALTGTIKVSNGSWFIAGTVGSEFGAPSSGTMTFNRTSDNNITSGDFYSMFFGGAKSTNGQLQFVSSTTANPLFRLRDGTTNAWADLAVGSLTASTNLVASNNVQVVSGALIVGPSGASITNILKFSATLDFPSTAAGAVSDLPITATGVADGDVVALGVPSGSVGPLTGDFFAWASNAVVYVRFANNNLVTAQDPASGTFKVIVTKF